MKFPLLLLRLFNFLGWSLAFLGRPPLFWWPGDLRFAHLFKTLLFSSFVFIWYGIGVNTAVESSRVHSLELRHLGKMSQSEAISQRYQVQLFVLED